MGSGSSKEAKRINELKSTTSTSSGSSHAMTVQVDNNLLGSSFDENCSLHTNYPTSTKHVSNQDNEEEHSFPFQPNKDVSSSNWKPPAAASISPVVMHQFKFPDIEVQSSGDSSTQILEQQRTGSSGQEGRIDERLKLLEERYGEELSTMLRECDVDREDYEDYLRELSLDTPYIHKYSVNISANVLQLHLSISSTVTYNAFISMTQYLYLLIYLDTSEHLRLIFPDIQQEFCEIDLTPHTEILLNNTCNCIQMYFIDEEGGDQHVITKNVMLDFSGELADALSFQLDSPSSSPQHNDSQDSHHQSSGTDNHSSANSISHTSPLEQSMIVLQNILTVRNPTPHFVHYEMGRVLMKLNRFEESEKYLRLEIQKGCADSKIFAFNSMGTLLKKQQQVPKAISFLSRAIAMRPNYFEALLTLSTILCIEPMEGYVSWKKLLARAFRLRPDDPLFLKLFVSLMQLYGRDESDEEEDLDQHAGDGFHHKTATVAPDEFSFDEIIELARRTDLSKPLKLRTREDFPSSVQNGARKESSVQKVRVEAPRTKPPSLVVSSGEQANAQLTPSPKQNGGRHKFTRTLSSEIRNLPQSGPSCSIIITNLPENLKSVSINEVEASLESFSQSLNRNLLGISDLPVGKNLIIRLEFGDGVAASISVVLHTGQEYFYEYHSKKHHIERSKAKIRDIPQENIIGNPLVEFDSLMNDPLLQEIMNE